MEGETRVSAMRRAAGVVVLALVCAIALPIVIARPAAAAFANAVLTNNGAKSGGPNTAITYGYSWDSTDCEANGVVAGDTIELILDWDSPVVEEVNSSTFVVPPSGPCAGAVSGFVPGNTTTGEHSPTASLVDETQGGAVANSQAVAPDSFTVPAPTPPPTPTRTPTPRPTIKPTPTPSLSATPTPVPTPTSKPPTPAPTPLPTPTPFVIGGGGGGSGGGTPQGGADCSAGIGRSPTGTELQSDTAELDGTDTDPTALEIQLLSSDEYYSDAGGTALGFINRLYDDVLRHDPTEIEVATALPIAAGGGDAGRTELAQEVVLSSEARAIRVDQAWHALLKVYPSSADLALWVNMLSGVGAPGVSGNTMVEDIATSPGFYALAGGSASDFMTTLYQDLLNEQPTSGELTADAALMAQVQAGSAAARLTVAKDVVSSAQFRADEVTSFFANYMHPTCRELVAQECTTSVGAPTLAELSTALASFASGTTEEEIVAGVLGSDQYYANHGSTQTGLINGVYQDLVGTAPTNAELSSALDTYTNDSVGHLEFAQAMVDSLAYQNLVVSLDYQQLLLRAPLPSELTAGEGVLAGGIRSLQTPDELLIESIASTPEFYGDDGGTDVKFVDQTVSTLLMRPAQPAQATTFLDLAPPHDSSWQAAVAQTLVDGPEYRTDFVRGAYAKFLTYSVCAVSVPGTSTDTGDSFFKDVPGGWFGLGLFVGVLIMGVAAAVFFALERRRFSRLYPNEVPRHRPQ
jgi:hypothetical protein